ncbi:alpha/beta hydrolase family protein [Lutimonas zeaxanthinifaciens]|uniref:alpha/beta hydrolase family protein n=1 Tax=Lutimonas zeaxanthinifaciens TaxID=3060215 RepID=UPI00265CB1FD|nr:alpha/beta fold hydrolase [Lutimonas sp. YSD2104]WKK64579.1 alpha/beta hydrolase [Lutimonas sp. YSD2104]
MRLKIYFFLLILLLGFAQHAHAQKIPEPGIYSGPFQFESFETDLEFDISKINDQYFIKFNSLGQNAFGIPAGDVSVRDTSLSFALQSDFYRYEFECSSINGNDLPCQLTVDGHTYDFELNKQTNVSESIRSKDIRLRSGSNLLYGTIYYPEHPNGKAIYLVTSSGNQDRSGSRAEALLFAKAGFISFHIDKRGTGLSDGNWHLADIPELCGDDLHALEFLHESEKISFEQIGIIGSSQGGAKVPYILQKQPKLAYGVIVSCPASTLLESDLNYWKNRNKSVIGTENIEDAALMQDAVFQYIASNLDKQSLEAKISQNESKSWIHQIWIPNLDEVIIDKKLNYTPLPYFKNLNSPLLVIEGGQDQVIPDSSLEKIEKSIGKKANKKNKYLRIEGADHSMMLRENSDFSFWSSLHPDYFKTVLQWTSQF